MTQKIFAAFLIVMLFLTPFSSIHSEAKGPAKKTSDDTTVVDGTGKGSSNSKHNRTTEPTLEPVSEIIEEPSPVEEEFVEPIPSKELVNYTVQSGDTLWIISLKYETTVEEIKALNNLTSDMIYVGQVLLVPAKNIKEEPTNESIFLVLGYYTKYWDNDLTAYRSLENYHSHINSVAITTYQINANGSIETIAAPEALKLAHEKGVKTYATIQNHFQPELTHTLLSSSELRQTAVQNIYTLVKNESFTGVNIDFENMYATDRQLFNQFIKEVSEFFTPKGYDLIVSVSAKTADNPTWAWSGTFDYAFLGQYAKLQLMSYDNSGTWSTPGATSGVDWVENVLKYATTLVPSEKLLIGLPAYGYEWYTATGKGIRALSLKQIDTIIAETKATVRFDEKTQTPFFTYKDNQGLERIVWFENEQSIQAKMNLVSKYNLGGVSMWRMGLETDSFWNTITNHLK
ncbi:LysM peptidoglycan-binding domain-containing protein [Anaerobacillus sp. CMMVII]|uniref:glycosyl hydrolase family 18 protein n=1 Tax=Anaerobacillus sp. CMMVII TaxID=2755588 RepID=UPI0021C4ED64|nr:glycosyl hydrolase family 18 protein [Anaerobacillus sp. CMMVII]MCT8139338.1 LysM peptidoglycan-binding domain-containing protein [Anaerobacillus sp. CMMVII]